jgi:hypothetical protein
LPSARENHLPTFRSKAMNDSSEPDLAELRMTLRSVGPALALVGLLLTTIGVASFIHSLGSFEPPRHFWCAIVGLPVMGVGLIISKFAYLGTIFRYMAGEVAPVSSDMTNYMVAETKDSLRDVAAAIGEGFTSGGTGTVQVLRCHKCNADNDSAAKFCDGCGAALGKTKSCSKCNELNDSDARFCDNCGTAVA